MSKTLQRIMNHFIVDITDETYIDFPFNVEEFCSENDAIIEKLKKRNEFLEECFNCSTIDISEVIMKGFNRKVGE
jgi:hypothetical protein